MSVIRKIYVDEDFAAAGLLQVAHDLGIADYPPLPGCSIALEAFQPARLALRVRGRR